MRLRNGLLFGIESLTLRKQCCCCCCLSQHHAAATLPAGIVRFVLASSSQPAVIVLNGTSGQGKVAETHGSTSTTRYSFMQVSVLSPARCIIVLVAYALQEHVVKITGTKREASRKNSLDVASSVAAVRFKRQSLRLRDASSSC